MSTPEPSPARPATQLQQQLASRDRPRHPMAIDAVRLARRKFLDAQRIDMVGLAEALGVNRVTLYRWVGSRDQLLVEVVWSLGRRTLALADERVQATGAERIVQVVTRFLEAVIANAGMRRWLADEGESAMRLLTRHDTDFQPRLIAAIHGLLSEEARARRVPARPCREMPFVESANYYFIGATLSRTPGHPVGALMGDLLVRMPRASGAGRRRKIPFPIDNGLHLGGLTHFDLLNHPAVYAQMCAWIKRPSAGPAPALATGAADARPIEVDAPPA